MEAPIAGEEMIMATLVTVQAQIDQFLFKSQTSQMESHLTSPRFQP